MDKHLGHIYFNLEGKHTGCNQTVTLANGLCTLTYGSMSQTGFSELIYAFCFVYQTLMLA